MRRVLIVRLGALGDVVHAIPVAAALKRTFPSVDIDWLVSAKHREVLDYVPLLRQRLVVNDRGASSGGLSMAGALRAMRREHYDVALDLQGLLKSALMARLSGAGRVVGFDAAYARESLARWFYTDVHHPGGEGMYAPSETRHVARINLGMLTALGVADLAVEFPLHIPDSPVAGAMIDQSGGRFALLNPGAAWPNKRWPPARLGALAAALKTRQRLMSVVLWGPGEAGLAEQVVEAARGAAIMTPTTSIGDVLALAKHCAVVVSGDTGPTHLATAVGAPLVGLFGPTRPERNGPWSSDDETVSRAGVCQCHHLRQCRAAQLCLLDIGVDEVLAAVERRLSRLEARRA